MTVTTGLHHAAYRCNNAQETVDFYTHVLGMEYVMAIMNYLKYYIKIKMKNSGDNRSSENANWKFSGNMVKDFEKHVSKSVPIYDRGQDLIIQLSDYFIKKDSIIYDIGCSTGKLLFKLIEHSERKENAKSTKYEVAAFGRHVHKRGAAAFGRRTLFAKCVCC